MKHPLQTLRKVLSKTRFEFVFTSVAVRHSKWQLSRVPTHTFRHAMRHHRRCCLEFLQILWRVVQKTPSMYNYSNLKKTVT